MAGPLLETKIHLPRRSRTQVPRPRVQQRLDDARDATLVLVSAPAGFGKTTVLSQWLAEDERAAWLSLDARDNDPKTFWRYVVAALQTVAPNVGRGASALLESPDTSTDAAVTSLVNDLHAAPDDVVLVLDDYHLIENAEVHDGMTFLLEHAPPRLHLTIACRADPVLPLARLRARGELVEIRATGLRFTLEEAAAYLTEAMGLPLTVDDVAALEGRTEGWIAALQLAALSLRGRADATAFIADFAGDDRYVVDFLVEEVLQRQPDHIRSFLLHTSILRSLSGPLCDAVTGGGASSAMLEALERANLFVVPLDDRRRWYRYHHLFADVLRVRLLDEEPHLVPALHGRASAWYEQSGDRAEAIRHALAGADFERAANLVELELPALQRDRQEARLRDWLDALPDDVVRVRPVLTVGYVGSLMSRSELAGVEERLQDAERWLTMSAEVGPANRPAEMVVVDEDRYRALPGAIAIYRAALARLHGDVAGTIAHAQRALDLAGPDDSLERGAASALLGLAHWTTGDLPAAHRRYVEAMETFHRTGYRSDVLGCAITVADLRLAQGRLHKAEDLFEWALERATTPTGAVLRGAADMHVGMSQVLRERNHLDEALHHLTVAKDLGEHLGLPQNPYRWRVAMARLRQAEGDLDGALRFLDEAQEVYVADYSPDVRPIAAARTRVQLARGDLDDAWRWVRRRGLSAHDELSYLTEFEHLTLARVLLAAHAADGGGRGHLAGATALLERLASAADAGGRSASVIEARLLLALACQASGDVAGARTALREAVRLAEPEGYVRLFADEGAPVASLLRTLVAEGGTVAYLRTLRAACSPGASPTPVTRGMTEALSEREIEVLRLLATELDGPGIARHLVVSVNTVRTHTKNIYAKLGVNSRRAAVRRAVELQLMPGAHRTSTERGR